MKKLLFNFLLATIAFFPLAAICSGSVEAAESGYKIKTQEHAVLVAHRGASHSAPECTIPAYKLAIKEGADRFEGDFLNLAPRLNELPPDPPTRPVR